MSTHGHLLAEGFAARLARNGRRPGTVTKYRAAVDHFLAWWKRPPAEVRRADIERYLDDWGNGMAPGTIRVRLGALKSFYDFLDSRGDLVDIDGRELRNPCERIERPRSRRKANDWLQADEDAAFQRAPITAQERILVSLLRLTGLRVGEACALTWRDVNTESIRVRESKTESGIRTIPLLPELGEELADWRRYLEAHGLYSPTGPVLVTANGTAMKAQFAWRLVKRVAARAGVRPRTAPDASGWNVSEVTNHTLRRTFATDLLNRGVRLETVAKVLGHSDTGVTQEYYAELLDQTARDEILSKMVS